MDKNHIWDCIVVGGGVIGSCTALHLANRGRSVLLIEQFYLPHSRGSSHGQSRTITRLVYDRDEYAVMMPEAMKQWKQIQEEPGETIYKQTGMLNIMQRDHPSLRASLETMQRLGYPHSMLSYQQLKDKLPMFSFPSDHQALWDPVAGILIPDKCQRVIQDLVRKHGGTIRDGEGMESVTPGPVVTVTTNRGQHKARQLVLAPGSWANDVVAKVGLKLPIKTMPGWPTYWPIQDVAASFKVESGFPIVCYRYALKNGYRFILFWPEFEYPGMVKVSSRGEPAPSYQHPDTRDLDDKEAVTKVIKEFLHKHVEGIKPVPAIVQPCMYTMTPDRDYIIDYHPEHSNIIIAAGFSGHGYQLGPVVGQLLSEMVCGQKTTFNINKFKHTRFGPCVGSKL